MILSISTILTTVLFVICATVIIFALIKYPHARPILVTLLCVAWVFAGFNSGIEMYRYYSTKSQVHGELDDKDPYADFNFYQYELKDFAWYKNDEGQYYCHKNYATHLEFDGTDESYILILNNKPCRDTISQNAKLLGKQNIKFYDINNNLSANIDLTISFTFYASNIDLQIDTNASDEGIKLLTEYVKVNGFTLRIIKKVYTNNQILNGGQT